MRKHSSAWSHNPSTARACYFVPGAVKQWYMWWIDSSRPSHNSYQKSFHFQFVVCSTGVYSYIVNCNPGFQICRVFFQTVHRSLWTSNLTMYSVLSLVSSKDTKRVDCPFRSFLWDVNTWRCCNLTNIPVSFYFACCCSVAFERKCQKALQFLSPSFTNRIISRNFELLRSYKLLKI